MGLKQTKLNKAICHHSVWGKRTALLFCGMQKTVWWAQNSGGVVW